MINRGCSWVDRPGVGKIDIVDYVVILGGKGGLGCRAVRGGGMLDLWVME